MSKVKMGELPAKEVRSFFTPGLNPELEAEQREPAKVDEEKLDAGPQLGEKGEYKPATYRLMKRDFAPNPGIRTDR